MPKTKQCKYKKIGKFNLLKETICDLKDCQCGWNIHIGGEEIEDLKKLKKLLIEFFK